VARRAKLLRLVAGRLTEIKLADHACHYRAHCEHASGDEPGGNSEELNGAWGRNPARPVRAPGAARIYFVQSLDRGLAVIRCFSEHPSLTLSTGRRATGLCPGRGRFLLTCRSWATGSSGASSAPPAGA
jgi:hypothetical protein